MALDIFINNPYFSAGAGLLGLGTVAAIFRQGVIRYSYFIKKQFLISLEIPSKDKSYHWVLHWLANKTQSQSNHLSVQTLYKLHDNGSSSSYFNFVPSPGIHYIKWLNKWIKVDRQREKGTLDLSSGGLPFESVTLTMIGRNTSVFASILEEAKVIALQEQQGKTVIYTSWANEWRPFGQPHAKRPLSSVVLANDFSKKLLNDVQEFISNGKWYYDRGIPYRRGYLLYGPPGTGKSSYIKALAGELDYNICIINLNESVMTDDRLNYLLSVLPERSLLLLEDIDALFTQQRDIGPSKQISQSRVTFSGLLNALDGVGSSEERIIFMTTNHFERLDPALIRPGRIDVQAYIGNATKDQICRMFKQFYPDAAEELSLQFSESLGDNKCSPAKIQGHFIMHKLNAQACVASVNLLT